MKELSSDFSSRQYMNQLPFELFYYNDINLNHISSHAHQHYEIYFFLEGDVIYEIDQISYPLKTGDFLLIPPNIPHRPLFQSDSSPYRRFILWIDPNYFDSLIKISADFYYAFETVKAKKQYHYRTNFILSQEIRGKLMDLLEEIHSDRKFKTIQLNLMVQSLILHVNRTTYDLLHQVPTSYANVLYLNVCDYINNHLNDNLSLDTLASFFYVSKYHLSHLFKDNMGISLHQYIVKKRLQASKNGILSGIPLKHIYHQYGFSDYTSFYRAFKKEFGLSPTEFKRQHPTAEQLIL